MSPSGDPHVARDAVAVAARFGGRASPIELIGAGEWSRAYALTLDGRAVVIKIGRYGEDHAKDALMSRLAPAGLPIPAVLEQGRFGADFFTVSQRAYGDFLEAVPDERMRRVLPDLFATLEAIAAVDVPGTSGFGGWSPDGRAPFATWREALLSIDDDRPRLGDWRTALRRSPVGLTSFTAGFARLVELAADLPDERRLIHMDLLNRNVLVDGTSVSAVFDWGNAMYGDPLYDAAWLVHWWPWFPAWEGIAIADELQRHWRTHAGVPDDAAGRLLAYQLHIGLDHLAYTATRTGREDDLVRHDQQMRALLDG